jgi:hypothetical protein
MWSRTQYCIYFLVFQKIPLERKSLVEYTYLTFNYCNMRRSTIDKIKIDQNCLF